MNWLRLALLPLLLACGSTTSTNLDADAGNGDASGPVGTDAGDAGDASVASDAAATCVSSPALGTACTPGQVSCDRVDPCCAQVTVCDDASRTWKESGVACFQCEGFVCGPKTCPGGSVCLVRGSGVDGGSSTYECITIPAACSRDWTCGCVTQNLGASCNVSPSAACTDTAKHVTVSCLGQ